ncbi:hypothetical protein MHBO_002992 [Bonamia ostreae]|uniref:RRM domain-containing protein n=1 Tax=Bonamia ostreae TaxID=126728 RepID=A0ABV2APX7_9EUKA
MAHFMPPSLLALFAPNPPIKHIKAPTKKKPISYTGLASMLHLVKKHASDPLPKKGATNEEKRARRRRKQKKINERMIEKRLKEWDPKNNKEIASDPYRTLFVARLSYKATKEDLLKEFNYFGAVKSVALVKDKKGQPRGYAFVEFKHKDDLKSFFRQTCPFVRGVQKDGRTPN